MKSEDERHSSRLAWKTRRLARVGGQLAKVSAARLELIHERVLAVSLRDGEHALYGSSALNNDGAPLQLVLVSGPADCDVRLIGDPYAFLGNVEARLQSSIEALRRALEDNGDAGFSDLAEESLATVLPPTPAARASYAEGFIWIASSLLERPGTGFYLEAAPLGQTAGWETAATLLRKVSAAPEEALRLIDGLRENTIVASIGLEGTNAADSRIKIYFRFTRPAALSELGIDLFGAQEMNRFLEIAMGSFGLDLDGLVLCLGVNASEGRLADVKIDLCGHCLTYSDEQWVEVAGRCVEEFGLQPLPLRELREALAAGDCRVAFIGFAIDRKARRRLNLYLQGCERKGVPQRDETIAALEDGIAYLCRLQDDAGKWTDFQLPVGASDQWVTAYVGLALAQAGKYLQHEKALDAAAKSARWLLRNQHYAAGWGYNTQTGADVDSTSVCLALLRELEIDLRHEDQNFLRQHWHAAGGFSTYREANAWGTPHWDVTPLGYLALAENEQKELREPFLRALREHRLAGNMWRSYWWRMPFYSTFMTLEALDKLRLSEPADAVSGAAPAQMLIDNSFDLACLVGIEILRGAALEQTGAHARTLLAWQQRNGSWRGHANLRVTEDSCYAPWESPAGEYFKDEAGTITTATVARVLTHYLSRALPPAAV